MVWQFFLLLLRFFPVLAHLFQGHVLDILVKFLRLSFDIVETVDELLVGMLKGIVWIYLV